MLLIFALMLGLSAGAAAARSRRSHRTPTPTLTPTATPTIVLRPVVLITGGTGTVDVPTGVSPAVLESAEIYDVETSEFLVIQHMDARRDHHDAALLHDGRVLIAGGVDAVLVPTLMFPGPAMPWILKSTETFSPLDGFAKAEPMSIARDDPTATVLKNGKVLVVGGSTDETELFDPEKGTFAGTGKMTTSRYRQTATLLEDGRVLIVGGGDRKAELYNLANGKFATTGAMSSDRIYHTSTLLPDGHVLVAGGSPYSRNASLDTTEIYNPKAGQFKAGSKMKDSRAGHTATLLKNGRVLIAGGHNDNSAEIYDPAKAAFGSLRTWKRDDSVIRRRSCPMVEC